MLIRQPRHGQGKILSSEITSHAAYLKRREFLALTAGGLGLGALGASPGARAAIDFGRITKSRYDVEDEVTDKASVTTYNNFYEFGTDKGDPKENSGDFKPLPWKVKVLGECDRPGDYHLDDLVRPVRLEERIYRLRCVEAWSMVVPWIGISLASVLKRFEPTSKAKYVSFRTVYRPDEMPGQRRPIIDWPYVEGLRIDEAMHPLSFLAVGIFGEALPNQNGAPLRLVVPWKYGFKSIKSIASIRFTEEQPETSWNILSPREYGFYSNVNPTVDHPRWSQARERRIGEFLKRETLMFNGYADEVSALYAGMDLRRAY